MRKIDRIILKTRDSVIAKSMLILATLVITLCVWNLAGTLITTPSTLSTLAGVCLSAVWGAILYCFWYLLFSKAYTEKLEESEKDKSQNSNNQ